MSYNRATALLLPKERPRRSSPEAEPRRERIPLSYRRLACCQWVWQNFSRVGENPPSVGRGVAGRASSGGETGPDGPRGGPGGSGGNRGVPSLAAATGRPLPIADWGGSAAPGGTAICNAARQSGWRDAGSGRGGFDQHGTLWERTCLRGIFVRLPLFETGRLGGDDQRRVQDRLQPLVRLSVDDFGGDE